MYGAMGFASGRMQASNLPLEPQVIATAADVGPIVRARQRDQALRIDDAAALTGVSKLPAHSGSGRLMARRQTSASRRRAKSLSRN
jgi:hypothetical protein